MKKLAFVLVLLTAAWQANAAENTYLTFGVGKFDLLHNEASSSTEFRLEYRHPNIWHQLYPSLGLMVNTDGGVYGVLGVNYDINLTQKITLTPFTGVGIYTDNDSKDLGGPIQFRSGMELAYELDNDYRVGLNFSHMSNASLYESNPGVESLVLNVSIPY